MTTIKIYWVLQFSSVQPCLALWDPVNRSTPGLPVHHQLPESTQTHVHWASDTIQPSHLLLSPSPPALNLSQHQGLFKWVSSLYQVAKVLDWVLTRGLLGLFYTFNICFNSFNVKKMRAICRLNLQAISNLDKLKDLISINFNYLRVISAKIITWQTIFSI